MTGERYAVPLVLVACIVVAVVLTVFSTGWQRVVCAGFVVFSVWGSREIWATGREATCG